MRHCETILAGFCLVVAVLPARADKPPLNCAKASLAAAVEKSGAGETIQFTGICSGPIVVRQDGLTLQGIGGAVIDGQNQDAVTIAGAQRVTLAGMEIRNGLNGIAAVNGAHVSLRRVSSHHNILSGIAAVTGSGLAIADSSASNNGLHGLDVETGSAADITGTFTASSNRIFGIDVNGSSVNFTGATVTASGNALGIQIATGANAFIAGPGTVINTPDNLAVGLTVVSGAHMVAFGGTINSSGNPIHGVSVNSKAGLDMDAGAVLNSFNNGQDGVHLEENSVMTVFNTPQFSGNPGTSTIHSHDNGGNGIKLLTDSVLTLVNQAAVDSTANTVGLLADNGSSAVLVGSTLTANRVKDLQLTFGSRADLSTTTVGTWSCDATVLVRGTAGITCPR